MTDIKISIIMPIYNVEKYLRKCLDSVLENQTLKDIEVICVDDSSPDKCPEIIEEYAKNDSRVKVIHKENAGQGVARNKGLEIATGEYVLFLDPDDWMEKDSLEKLYNKIKSDDSDVLFFNVIRNFEKNGQTNFYRFIEPYYIKFKDRVFHPLEAKDIIYQTTAHPFKIYKRESLIKYNFQYSQHRHWEDHLPYFCFLANCEKISTLNEYVYNYLVRKNSSTFTSGRCIEDIFSSFYECEKELSETKYGKDLMQEFIKHRLRTFYYYLSIIPINKKFYFYKNLKKAILYISEKYGNNIFDEYLDGVNTILEHSYLIYLLVGKIKKTKIILNSHKI